MATKHICDRCGAEVKTRADFWKVTLRKAEAPVNMRGVREASRAYEEWELCEKCKKQIYVALHEPSGDCHG